MLAYIVAALLMLTGIAVVALKRNLIKKIIGLSILGNGLHLLLISIGYRSGGLAPIMRTADTSAFVQVAVDPLPQALVLTSIVINISVVALGLVMTIEIYRHFKTLDMGKVRRLKG